MRVLAESLGYAVAAGFVLLAIRAVLDSIAHRERRQFYLACAIVGLAILALASQLELAYPPVAQVGGGIALGSLMVSAYALLLFRSTFIPLPRVANIAAGAAVLAATLIGIFGASLAGSNQPLQVVRAVAPLAVWLICVGEPTVRFWLAARGRPAVQRSRLRALSFGYGSIVLILLLSLTGLAGTASESGLRIVALMWTIALCALPLLYMAFWPPRWLRSRWREREEASFRRALQGLLLAATEEQAAAAVVEWGMRLVGAQAAVLALGGRPVSSVGLADAEATSLAAESDSQVGAEAGALALRGERLYLNLVQSGHGSAQLVLMPGEFSPIFGADEMNSLRQFAVPATAALERLRLISELTQANSAKRDFLSRMSHELRTPLNSVIGFSQLLEGELTDPKQSRQVSHINEAGRHLLALINDILDLSRIEARQMSMTLEPVSVAITVQQAVDLISPLAGQRGVIVEVDEAIHDQFVLADGSRLAQVLINLLSNAVKYNHDAGRVRLYCETAGAGRVRLHVADTGIGIEPESQDRVFQPFVRVNQNRSSVQGTGIGLSLSRELAEMMDGSLDFVSRTDEGSDFWIELPQASHLGLIPPSRPRQAALPDNGIRRHARVLYIEDNRANADLMAAIVARLEGVRLDVASTGEMGLKLAGSEPPDIVFLDQHLPDISGLEVLRRIRSQPSLRETAVVMISADVAVAKEQHRFAGAQDFLTKPLDVGSVVSAIDQAMRRRSAGSSGDLVAVAR